jgi:predicted metal-dependent HD superfamily phosphohydrolase
VKGLGTDRWKHLWQAIDANGDALVWYETLTSAFAEPQRHYHNGRHIAECLAEFDVARHLARQPEAVELAVWFHDAVYDPKRPDNEEQSAAMAKCCLETAGLADLARTVAELVMATKTHSPAAGSDAALLIDLDLSILGRDETRVSEYESQIRAEYAWVPEHVFKTKRSEILQRFLDRTRIYNNDHFFARYEATARRNLTRAIQRLESSP